MKTEFTTFFRYPILVGLAIAIFSIIGCSSENQTINSPDLVSSIGSTPEVALMESEQGDASSHGEIVTSVLEPGPSGESIETVTTEEEVLADLLKFDKVYQNLGIKKITDIVDPVDGVPRLYIATQDGIIYSVDRDEDHPNADTFLDLQNLVSTQ